MFFRQIPIGQYEMFRRSLDTNVRREPLDVTYHVDLTVNRWRYRLHFFIAHHRKLVPLQAVKLDGDIQKCELITDMPMLGALLELVIAQYSGAGTGCVQLRNLFCMACISAA